MVQAPEQTERMRRTLAGCDAISEKAMMGGICFFLHGNMIGGADRPKHGAGRFMFRVGKDNAEKAAELGATSPLMLGDRIMPGFYFVEAECDEQRFAAWLDLALRHARSLPPK